MYIFNYFFKNTKENNTKKTSKKNKSTKEKSDLLYLVINKNTQLPLGIYDTLEQAKIDGQTATYHNCSILEFKLNDKCKYLMNPIFEN